MSEDINKINHVIDSYFEKHPERTIVPVKELMPHFIAAGVFKKDFKNGKPIRDVLRLLHRDNTLDLIPCLHVEEKNDNIYWYFIPKGAPKPTSLYKQEKPSVRKEESEKARLLSDESYVIDLCDTFLVLKADRQKRFNFLLGDLHRDGVTRTKLPVDAYYASLDLVVEYKEMQRNKVVLYDADNPNPKTVSGISRAEQRKIYDQRRAIDLPLNGITLLEIHYDAFEVDAEGKIIRNPEEDLKKVAALLTPIIEESETTIEDE